MTELLFLAQRIPYPPNKGDKIRSWHVLADLARRWPVHLGALIDDPDDWRHVGELERICASTCFVPLDRRRAKLRSLRALGRGQPLTLPYFHDRRLAEWVDRTLDERPVTRAYVFSSAMAQYVGGRRRPARLVMDYGDIDSDKWRQYAETRGWPMSWVFQRESRRLLAFERQGALVADATIFVSEPEAELFRRLAPESHDRVHAIGNGVDSDYFSPEREYEAPLEVKGTPFVFTGAMDYWPNVDAVCWFAREILPLVRRRIPDAVFWIVGSNPAPEVMALAGDGILVTGRVADVRPYLAHARAAVVPIRIARGIQNKVLEAMAMAKPVVTTGMALEGISAAVGRDLLQADEAAQFAAASIRVAQDPAAPAMGAAARQVVLQGYSWASRQAAFAALLDGETALCRQN